MDIEFVCEHCGGTVEVQDYLAGQSIECYHCHGMVVVPMPGEKGVIEFACLGCGSKFRVPGSRAGSRTKCPKCDALLVVPDATSRVAPAPVASVRPSPPPAEAPREEEFIPPPSPLLSRHAGLRGRSRGAGPGAQAEDAEDVIAKPVDRVPAGMIIFWVGLAVVFLIALSVFISRRNQGAAGGSAYAEMYAEVKYNGLADVFQIRNTTRGMWSNTRLTIETSQGEFVAAQGEWSEGETRQISGKQFTGSRRAWNLAIGGKTFIITATLPNGRPGRFKMNWGGIKRPPAGAPGPAPAPAPTPKTETETDPGAGGEGGTIRE